MRARVSPSGSGPSWCVCTPDGLLGYDSMFQVEMTPPGSMIRSTASAKEKRILDAKYKIFRETIEIQRKWRQEIDSAAGL